MKPVFLSTILLFTITTGHAFAAEGSYSASADRSINQSSDERVRDDHHSPPQLSQAGEMKRGPSDQSHRPNGPPPPPPPGMQMGDNNRPPPPPPGPPPEKMSGNAGDQQGMMHQRPSPGMRMGNPPPMNGADAGNSSSATE